MIFQNYFCGWLAEYNDSIELIYVGGLRNFQCKQIVKSSGEAVIVEELSGGQQEEADERMMLHVNHAEKKGVESVGSWFAQKIRMCLCLYYITSKRHSQI